MSCTRAELLAFSAHVAQPPTSEHHARSLYASMLALQRCLEPSSKEAASSEDDDSLSTDLTCKAWSMLAEVGLSLMNSGRDEPNISSWTRDIDQLVAYAIEKGLQLSLTSKSLRGHWIHLNLLHSHFQLKQSNPKYSRATLKKLRITLTPSDPAAFLYGVILSQHASHIFVSSSGSEHRNKEVDPRKPNFPSNSSAPSSVDVVTALNLTTELHTAGKRNGHIEIAKLALLSKLRTVVHFGLWTKKTRNQPLGSTNAETVLPECELAFGFPDFTELPQAQLDPTSDHASAFMQAHVLVMGILYYSHLGESGPANIRLSQLHAILDRTFGPDVENEIHEDDASGCIAVPTTSSEPPLIVRMTHPRVLYELAFLLSSVSKRDLVGRKPRRKLFSEEGLKIADLQEEVSFPAWATVGDMRSVEIRLAKIKADLLCEMIAIATIRSEHELATEYFEATIAHTRSYDIFDSYAARITLHQAHMAHATLNHNRALKCYRAAAFLDPENESPVASSVTHQYEGSSGGFVRTAARAGEVALRLGLHATRHKNRGIETSPERMDLDHATPTKAQSSQKEEEMELMNMASEVIEECKSWSGTLHVVGKIIEAVVSTEIVRAKQRLKTAMDISTQSSDNNLLAIVLSMSSAHYMDTATEHASKMLETARQLAAGHGAPENKGASLTPTGIPPGNLAMSLWIGERLSELHRRQGRLDKLEKQRTINDHFRRACRNLPPRFMAHHPAYSGRKLVGSSIHGESESMDL